MKFPQLIEKAGEKIKQQKYGKTFKISEIQDEDLVHTSRYEYQPVEGQPEVKGKVEQRVQEIKAYILTKIS